MRSIRVLTFFTAMLVSSCRGEDMGPKPPCNEHERFTECASSTCFEETCTEIREPIFRRKKCTKDCRRGCQCKPGFYRNFDGRCVDEKTCLMCGYGEVWLDCGRGSCPEEEYDLTCDIVVNDSGGVIPFTTSGCKCGTDFYRSFDSLCVSKAACEFCGINEEWEPCGSSSCWEFTCDDMETPISDRWPRACTLDCHKGCKCHKGFYRDNITGECVTAETCN